jgi:3' terminal RNA ribose 2'-O-methyltransferase Hen1
MLLTITLLAPVATDLGYLLHKNPSRVHRFDLSFGRGTVFYPEAREDRCTACLLVEIDPIGLVRKTTRPAGDGGIFSQYVNDRPYVASSFLSVAMSEVFGTALAGRSKDRPELAARKLPFEVGIPVLPGRGGEKLIKDLFEPLGYAVSAERISLDSTFTEWGSSRYYSVTLSGEQRLQDLLSHINVLVPVLDDEKHYWVGDDEVEKLLRRGGAWLPSHPAKDLIARRYLKHRKSLAREALERLAREEESADLSELGGTTQTVGREEALETKISLNAQRLVKVIEVVEATDAKSVVDLGCGEGNLLRELLKIRQLGRIVGMDVSLRSLEIAAERLRIEQMAPTVRNRISLMHGSLMYRDKRLQGFDLATAIEVIEHLDRPRLQAFERVLFEQAHPKAIVVTTPNAEYNIKFESLPEGQFRHPDHRFEWSRRQFEDWARTVAERFQYAFRLDSIGDMDDALGAPTQMAVFEAV